MNSDPECDFCHKHVAFIIKQTESSTEAKRCLDHFVSLVGELEVYSAIPYWQWKRNQRTSKIQPVAPSLGFI